jgi:hypothetical protein
MAALGPLPKPVCKYGFTKAQLRRHFGKKMYIELLKFLRGSTYIICPGKPVCKQAHNAVTYVCDVDRFRRFLR